MNRRRLLAAVGGLGAAVPGCLGPGGNAGALADPPASSGTPSPVVVSGVEVPPCPERPTSLTRDSVVRFAIRFERAYLARVTLRETDRDVVSVDVDVRDPEATATRRGWVVRFAVVGPAYRYRRPESTGTAHVDPPLTTAHYLVTDAAVYRALSPETVAPREHGTPVRCPP